MTFLAISCGRKTITIPANQASSSPWKDDLYAKQAVLEKAFKYRYKHCLGMTQSLKEEITITDRLESALIDLDSLRKLEIDKMTSWYRDQQTDNVDFYRYQSTAYCYELMYVIPDVYATILNPVRRVMNPKVSHKIYQQSENLIDTILIESKYLDKDKQYKAQFSRFIEDAQKYNSGIFQGDIEKIERQMYQKVNFLLFRRCLN